MADQSVTFFALRHVWNLRLKGVKGLGITKNWRMSRGFTGFIPKFYKLTYRNG